MTTLALALAAAACLVAVAFFSGCEMGLYCLNRIRLRLRAEQEHGHAQPARLLLRLTARQSESVLATLLWQNIASYLLTVAAVAWVSRLSQQGSAHVEFYTAAILSPLNFALGDVVPKNWFRIEADRLMYRAARLLYPCIALVRVTGLVWLLELVPRLAVRFASEENRLQLLGPRGEVVGLLREGAAEGALTEEQTRIVERVLGLSSIRVGALMIPRSQVLTVPIEASEELFRLVVRRHPFTHLPVLGADRRIVAGVVNVNEVLADEAGYSLERHLKSPISVHAVESAAKALVQLQRADVSLAIVTEPRRGFVGIITLTDIVEEIFGELGS
jgi:CBS domain containing-hemolysin-like protein